MDCKRGIWKINRIASWLQIVMVVLRMLCGKCLWEYCVEFLIEKGEFGGGFGYGFESGLSWWF